MLPPAMLEDEEAVKGWMSRAFAYAQILHCEHILQLPIVPLWEARIVPHADALM